MGNRKLKISVVTVCYNAVDSIEKTIKSVVNQTYDNIEYVIIDGLSKDGTIGVINEYREKIAYFVSEPDKGIYDAMNKGIKAATGDWIIFMNAGDTFKTSDILRELGRILLNIQSDIRIIRGNIIRKYSNLSVKSTGVTSQSPGLMDMINNTFHHQACLIQRSLFDDYGYYSTDYKLCSDWIFFYNCVVLHHVKTMYVDLDVALFEMDGATSVNTKQNEIEQSKFLTNLYGVELYGLLQELSVYRKSSLCRCFCRLYINFRSNLSPKNFNRLLTAKRYIRSILGLKVN